MSFNTLKDIEQAIGYLEQCAGFYYLQNPTSWQECFQQLTQSVPKLTEMISGDAVTEITNIASAYTSVGKDIYATAESGLKSAPVIEGVFTQAGEETAEVSATALGTYVAGVGMGVPIATAVAGILSGLGIGILGYETAPEGWVDISNAIFGTNISYESAQPLIKTYVQGLFSKNYDPTANKYYLSFSDTYLNRAYNYFVSHLTGGIDYEFLDNTVWQGTTEHPNIPTECTPATQHYLQNIDVDVTSELTQDWINYVVGVWKDACERYHVELGDFEYNDILSDLYSKYPNYHNANLFSVQCKYFWVAGGSLVPFHISINGYRVNDSALHGVNIDPSRNLAFGVSGSTGGAFSDSDFCYFTNVFKSTGCVFSYQRDLSTGVSIVRDDGQVISDSQHSHKVSIGLNGIGTSTDVRKEMVCQMWNAGSNSTMTEEIDDTLVRKGFIKNPKYDPNVDISKAQTKKPTTKTNFQDQYAYWYGGKKQVGQPNKQGEPEIITYIPTPVPASMPSAETILKNGVGVADNPNSYPVAPPDALPDYEPVPLSPTAPATDPTQVIVNNYNESRTTPNTAPNPIPQTEPNPQYPDTPPTDPNGDSGDTPTPAVIGGVTASGMVSVYNPTKAQLKSFSGWLWSPAFIDNFLKIFANPMDAIIGLHILYATPVSSGNENIIAGYLDSGVSSKVVTQQYITLDCGTVSIPEYYGNATDFEPYTTVHLYLPFVAIVPIRANDVIGKQVNVKYGIDVLTGTCLATVTTYKDGSEIACYTFAGNCAVQIAVSGGNYAQMITGLAGFLVSGVGAVVSGSPVMALGAGASLLHSSTSVQHSGSIGANAGACGIRKPYFIITRKKSYDAQNYQHYYGFPSNNHVTLNSCKGFTQIKSCHVESIYRATDKEKTEIETLLKQGVIIV